MLTWPQSYYRLADNIGHPCYLLIAHGIKCRWIVSWARQLRWVRTVDVTIYFFLFTLPTCVHCPLSYLNFAHLIGLELCCTVMMYYSNSTHQLNAVRNSIEALIIIQSFLKICCEIYRIPTGETKHLWVLQCTHCHGYGHGWLCDSIHWRWN